MPFGDDWVRRAAPKREPVAGPYRSQSSVPSIRRQATRHEHRSVNPLDVFDEQLEAPTPPAQLLPDPGRLASPSGLIPRVAPMSGAVPTIPLLADINPSAAGAGAIDYPGSPYTALKAAALEGVAPDAELRKKWPRGFYGQIEQAAIEKVRSEEDLGEPADLTNLALLLSTGGAGLALRGSLTAAGMGAGKLIPALRTAAGAATVSPLAAQAPIAAVKGDPGELGKAFDGTGVLANVTGAAGEVVREGIPGVAGAAAADAISLPAQVLPSTYLTGRAMAEAAAGDPTELAQLREDFQETSALPALLQGDLGEALSRAAEHPVYTALEGAGIKAGVGLGAGALLKRLGHPGFQHEARPPLVAYGDVAQHRAPYSRDAITRLRQRRADERAPIGPHGEKLLDPQAAARHLRHALDREVFAGEQVRRGNQRQVAGELNAAAPEDPLQRDVTAQAIQGIARNPESFTADLQVYRDELTGQQPHLTASELTANRTMIETIDKALANPDPEGVFRAVNAFVEGQRPITAALVERGLLDADQARKAIAIPYARAHMDAAYGLSRADYAEAKAIKEGLGKDRNIGELSRVRAREQTLSRDGDPLTLDEIEAHMRENGVEPANVGFVTQQPKPASGAASFFQPPNERPSMSSAKRTGVATERGTYDSSWEGVVRQAIHGRTMLDRVNNFEHILERFGLRAPDGRSFKDSKEAKRAAEHPEDFNMRLPEVPGGWKPVRLSPWLGKKSEVEAAADVGHNTALLADQQQMVENFSVDALKNALEPGDGPAILLPKVVTDRMRHHFQEILPTEKAAQAVTGAFKGAVLPTSPKWIVGNALDNYVVRAFGTGITPRDMAAGSRFAKLVRGELSEAESARALESIVPGGLYGQHARIQPYRALEQFAGTKIEPLARAAHAVLTTPGPKQVHDLFVKYRDTVFEFDSRFIEQMPQYGQLAKVARREVDMTRRQFRKAIEAQDPVLLDLARGLRDPERVDYFAKQVENVFGNWGKNGPEARRFLSTWAPFWMWGRAAFKFAFVTMPRDHPIITSLIAASEQMTREERQKLGFDFDADRPQPGYLQGSIPDPFNEGGVANVSGLTTYGTFANAPQFAASLPAPVFSSAILSGLGLDWKGDKLVDGDGRPAGDMEKVKAAVLGTLDGFIPFLNVGRSVADKGPLAGASPVKTIAPSTDSYLRDLHNTQEISVPITESGGTGGSSNPLDQLDSALDGGGSNPLDQLDKALGE